MFSGASVGLLNDVAGFAGVDVGDGGEVLGFHGAVAEVAVEADILDVVLVGEVDGLRDGLGFGLDVEDVSAGEGDGGDRDVEVP